MSEASDSHEVSTVNDLDDIDEKINLPIGADDTDSRLSVFNFEKLLEDHPCLARYNPTLPTKDQRANRPPPGKVALYQAYFTSSNLRLPLTKFYLNVLSYYKIGLAQMQPVGAGKILTFEMILVALRLPRSVNLFRKFFRLCRTGDWFTVSVRGEYNSLITNAPGTIKFWRFDYFFVDASILPDHKIVLLEWRNASNKKENSRFIREVNQLPEEHLVKLKHVNRVRRVSVPYRSYAKHEGILVLAGISHDWEKGMVPILLEKSTKKSMISSLLFLFIWLALCNFLTLSRVSLCSNGSVGWLGCGSE